MYREGGNLNSSEYLRDIRPLKAVSKLLPALPPYLQSANDAQRPAHYLMRQLQQFAAYGDQIPLPHGFAGILQRALQTEHDADVHGGALSVAEQIDQAQRNAEMQQRTAAEQKAHFVGNILARSPHRVQEMIDQARRNIEMQQRIDAEKSECHDFWCGFKKGFVGTLVKLAPVVEAFIPPLAIPLAIATQFVPPDLQSTGITGLDTGLDIASAALSA